MKRINLYIHGLLFCALAISILAFVNICYAQPPQGSSVPEPTSLALITSTGLLGWIVRFARKRFREFKRVFDIVVSSFGIVLSFPLVIGSAILIKIVSPGPVFFKQQRLGYCGRIFDIYKLRTMKVDAEKETGPIWASEDDPRYIKFGKIIRKLHIDEFPQLLNVLRGEMSIVGPRPERAFFVDKLSKEVKEYNNRLAVKPGITGLAQIRHKYDETIEDVKKKLKFDLLYIRKMCFWVDVRILLQTIIVAVLGKGAR